MNRCLAPTSLHVDENGMWYQIKSPPEAGDTLLPYPRARPLHHERKLNWLRVNCSSQSQAGPHAFLDGRKAEGWIITA